MAGQTQRQGLGALQQQQALNGLMQAPVSRRMMARTQVTKAARASVHKADTVVAGVQLEKAGNLPLAFQSNLPESTMMPPRVVPCPPMNLVAE